MPPQTTKSRRHIVLVMAFHFVAWLLVLVGATSIAILVNWYVQKADRPELLSTSMFAAGWISILLNFVIVSLAFDGMQRAIRPTTRFATTPCLLILSAVLLVESMQVYFFHMVSHPHQLHNYSGTMRDFSDWLYWAVAAFAGPIIKSILIWAYTHFAESHEHHIKAQLTVDID